MVNKVTTFLGYVAIVAAIISVFILNKVNWWDALGGGTLGITLIYVKNSSAVDKITGIFKLKKDKNERA